LPPPHRGAGAQDWTRYYTVVHRGDFAIDWGKSYRTAEAKTMEVRKELRNELDVSYGQDPLKMRGVLLSKRMSSLSYRTSFLLTSRRSPSRCG
jgi:hypothetical protein